MLLSIVDADEKTASATEWHGAGPGLPCTVISIDQLEDTDLDPCAYLIFDTKAGEESGDLLGLALSVDLLIVPTTPEALLITA